MKTWTAKLPDLEIVATTAILRDFFSFFVHDQALLGRMSELLLFDIYVLEQTNKVSPRDVLNCIANLEAGEPPNGITPATQFKRFPLKGIWHKHYFSARFLPKNIILALANGGIEKLVRQEFGRGNSPIVTDEMVYKLSHRVVVESFENRQTNGKVTGEWVLFTKHEGKNHYLTLCTHGDGDASIYAKIMAHCLTDFPNLRDWIASA